MVVMSGENMKPIDPTVLTRAKPLARACVGKSSGAQIKFTCQKQPMSVIPTTYSPHSLVINQSIEACARLCRTTPQISIQALLPSQVPHGGIYRLAQATSSAGDPLASFTRGCLLKKQPARLVDLYVACHIPLQYSGTLQVTGLESVSQSNRRFDTSHSSDIAQLCVASYYPTH